MIPILEELVSVLKPFKAGFHILLRLLGSLIEYIANIISANMSVQLGHAVTFLQQLKSFLHSCLLQSSLVRLNNSIS